MEMKKNKIREAWTKNKDQLEEIFVLILIAPIVIVCLFSFLESSRILGSGLTSGSYSP